MSIEPLFETAINVIYNLGPQGDGDAPESPQTGRWLQSPTRAYLLRPTGGGRLIRRSSGSRLRHSQASVRSRSRGQSSSRSSTPPTLVVHRHPAWRPPEFWDSIIHKGDLGRVLKEPVISISDESSEEEEREDDGVPADQRSPVRVYKIAPPAAEIEDEDMDKELPQTDEASRFPTPDEKDDADDINMADLRVKETDENAQAGTTRRKAPSAMLQREPMRGHRPQPPPALRVSSRGLRKEFPKEDFALGYTCLPDKMIRWGFRCFRCPGAPLLSGHNVGLCTTNFVNHLRSARHRKASLASKGASEMCSDARLSDHVPAFHGSSASGPPSSISSGSTNTDSSAASSSQSVANILAAAVQYCDRRPLTETPREGVQAALPQPHPQDDVEDFLRSVGLSPALAGPLREAGISDRARMRALGSLPDADFQPVDDFLKAAGLDTVARVLVKSGLRRCARATGTGGVAGA